MKHYAKLFILLFLSFYAIYSRHIHIQDPLRIKGVFQDEIHTHPNHVRGLSHQCWNGGYFRNF